MFLLPLCVHDGETPVLRALVNRMRRLFGPSRRAQGHPSRQELPLAVFQEMQELRRTPARRSPTHPLAEGIVFSRDRPLQLHALLGSYFDQVRSPLPLHVLYTGSTPRYRAAYAAIRNSTPAAQVAFIEQQDFHGDLLALLGALRAGVVFFLVDDIVFIAPTDLGEFARCDPFQYVPSLRLGAQLTYCYAHDRPLPLPPFLEGGPGGSALRTWRWSEGILDWGYPLSVDGHFFSVAECRFMASRCLFRAPNSFEAALQGFHSQFTQRLGACCETSRIVNIPANRVQGEIANRSAPGTAKEYLVSWEAGLAIDRRPLYGIRPVSVHQEIPLTFTPRHSPGAHDA